MVTKEHLISLLQEIQLREGYLSEASLAQLAQQLSVPPAHIYGVATFYSQFRFTPKGKHHVKVCHGTACHVAGAISLEEKIREKLAIAEKEEISKDHFCSIEKVACLGCCNLAPVWTIDDRLYGGDDSQKPEKHLPKKESR